MPALTRFHLLLDGRAGWRTARLDDSLELRPPVADPGGVALRLRVATGELLADEEGSFAGLVPPRGRTTTRRGDVWLAEPDAHRVRIVTCKGGVLRRVLETPPEAELAELWEPVDVAAAGDRVWVADRANGRVHRFDLLGRWRGAIDGAATEDMEDAEPFVASDAVAVDRDCRLYVAQAESDPVAVFDPEGQFLEWVEHRDEVEERFLCPNAPALADLAATGEMGEADAPTFQTAGTFLTTALDSRLERCVWHRVVLGARVPEGTLVEIETFTSEAAKGDAEIAALPDARWTRAASFTPGSRIGIQDRKVPSEPSPPTPLPGGEGGRSEHEVLVLSPPGRYLWLRLTLLGDGTATPELTSARLEFPRASTARYLPAVFQNDAAGDAFLDRFLSIFDTTLGGIRAQLDDLGRYIDPYATPAGGDEGDFLAWLGDWMGIAFEHRWSIAKRRRLVAEAHRLFALRGTPAGLALHVEICAGVTPRLVEHYRLRRFFELGGGRLGDGELWGEDIVRRLQLDVHSRVGDFQLLDSGDPRTDSFSHLAHHFTVYLPTGGGGDGSGRAAIERAAIERVVEHAKPAHTRADVVFVRPRLRVGHQARIGLDTVVGRYPAGVTVGGVGADGAAIDGTRLTTDAVLGPSPDEAAAPRWRVGKSARLGAARLD